MPPNFYLYEILWDSCHPGNEPRRAVVDLGRAGAAELVSAGRRGAGLISLVLLIPAFELLIMFLIQAGVVVVRAFGVADVAIVAAAAIRHCRSRRARRATVAVAVPDPRSHAAGGHRGLALGDADPRARGGLGGMATLRSQAQLQRSSRWPEPGSH